MPLGGKEVADELTRVCGDNKCPKINAWLNKLYLFREQYVIYKEGLAIGH